MIPASKDAHFFKKHDFQMQVTTLFGAKETTICSNTRGKTSGVEVTENWHI